MTESKIDILLYDYDYFTRMRLKEYEVWSKELYAYVKEQQPNWLEIDRALARTRRRLKNKETSRQIRGRNTRNLQQLLRENENLNLRNHELQAQYEKIRFECNELRNENIRLQCQLSVFTNGIVCPNLAQLQFFS